MSAAMGMDPSLMVTGISAVLQAAQTFFGYTEPYRAATVFADAMAGGAS